MCTYFRTMAGTKERNIVLRLERVFQLCFSQANFRSQPVWGRKVSFVPQLSKRINRLAPIY